MSAMFLIRFVLEMPAQKAWNKFRSADLKFNKRVLKRLMKNEIDIWAKSKLLSALPHTATGSNDEGKSLHDSNLKRVRDFSLSETDSPVKKRFNVDSDTTSSDDDWCYRMW